MAVGLAGRKVLDLSMPISPSTRVFEGYPTPVIHKWATYSDDGYKANFIFMVEHTGTHMDAPSHFFEGAPSIDELPPEKFVSRGVCLDFSHKSAREPVSSGEVEGELERVGARVGPGWYIIFRFDWDKRMGSGEWLRYPYLDSSVARLLAEKRVEGIGLDSPSPDYSPFEVHKILLPKGIVIIENMSNLESVSGRTFDFIVVPLKIRGGTASPVRPLALV